MAANAPAARMAIRTRAHKCRILWKKRVSQNDLSESLETRELRRKDGQRKSMPVRTKVTVADAGFHEYHDVTTRDPHVAGAGEVLLSIANCVVNAQVTAPSELRFLRSPTTLTRDFSTTQHDA